MNLWARALQNNTVIYQNEDGSLQLPVALKQETFWLTQSEIATLFSTSTDNVSLHLKNIYKTRELLEDSTTEHYSVVRKEGNRQVNRAIKHYNLDAILSIGYRVNSNNATKFRQWATTTLKNHLLLGYSINQKRFESNAAELQSALLLIDQFIKNNSSDIQASQGLAEIVSRYTQTFLWLQRYDEGLLESPVGQRGGVLASYSESISALETLKQQLIQRGEATELFAKLRDDGLSSLLGNLDQTVFGEPAYPSIESKAAHLLYFIVKNHPFTDGNKRSGAFLFVDFLSRNNRLFTNKNEPVINDAGLAALTLLVAQSDPKQKDTLINLIMNMLAQA